MRGLNMLWQKRRVSESTRADVKWCSDMLRKNMGRGYFAYDLFTRAPPVYTHASRKRAYIGGGLVSGDGEYLWLIYGTNAARSPIDRLEGDTVVSAVKALAHKWRRNIVTIHIDNTSTTARFSFLQLRVGAVRIVSTTC